MANPRGPADSRPTDFHTYSNLHLVVVVAAAAGSAGSASAAAASTARGLSKALVLETLIVATAWPDVDHRLLCTQCCGST